MATIDKEKEAFDREVEAIFEAIIDYGKDISYCATEACKTFDDEERWTMLKNIAMIDVNIPYAVGNIKKLFEKEYNKNGIKLKW